MILSVALGFSLTLMAAEETPLPSVMVVLGDSVSEGLLTEYSLERRPDVSTLMTMLGIAMLPSKERKIEEFRKRYAKPEHSWASGGSPTDIVFSHFERLQQYVPHLRAFNFAVSSQRASGLASQVDQVLQFNRETGLQVDYATLMIGANDLNRDTLEEITTTEDYKTHLENAIRSLLHENPRLRLLMVSLPDVADIFARTKDLTGFSVLGIDWSCDSIRRTIFNDSLLVQPDHPDFPEVMARLASYEDAMHDIAIRLRYEFLEADFKVIAGFKVKQSPTKAISADCFHPSIWGQAELAEATWHLGFWPDL